MEDDFVVLFVFLGLFKFLEICADDFSFLPVVTRSLEVAAEGGGLIVGAGAGVGVEVMGECSELESHDEEGGGGGLEGTEVEFKEEGVSSSFCLVPFPW